MIISAPIFEAYLKCPSKCWFLFLDEEGDANIYSDFIRNQNSAHQPDEHQVCWSLIAPRSLAARSFIKNGF